jgi:hypothetical protein
MIIQWVVARVILDTPLMVMVVLEHRQDFGGGKITVSNICI